MERLQEIIYGVPKPPTKRTRDDVQPHRCAKHVEDLLVAISNFEVQDQFSIVWKCMRSEKGDEPPRHSSPEVKPDHNV
ncbi:hypothetical protein BGZ83_000701 [Gryganskiella cystojenkinii]|nr:hypothetical protein BGZ83_000701 [Gryganskiella cystojenkinii]